MNYARLGDAPAYGSLNCAHGASLALAGKDLDGTQLHQHSQAVYDQEFIEVSMSKYKGKYVVLFF